MTVLMSLMCGSHLSSSGRKIANYLPVAYARSDDSSNTACNKTVFINFIESKTPLLLKNQQCFKYLQLVTILSQHSLSNTSTIFA
jgi:hypothetical protein